MSAPNLNCQGETAQSPAEHSESCWAALVRHCEGGRCTCHIGIGGSVHVLNGCSVGRHMYEEYQIATQRVRDLARKAGQLELLEAGDMGSTLEEAAL